MSRISLRRLSERADLSVPRGSPQMGARYDADAFGRFAEGMARFLGTGRFIVGQTVLVVGWIILNTVAPSSTGTRTRSSCSTWPSRPRRPTPRR